MAKHAAHVTACFAILACLPLAGCATRPPMPAHGAVELRDTPFFAQDQYQCGPAALAMVLGAAGVAVQPEELTSQVYLPARRGSLQVEMRAVPRRYGRLSLPLPRSLEAIIAELDAGRPVLVLHNYGLPIWPRWHYAVVVGYDAGRQRMVLRSGRKQRHEMRARSFMVAWHNGGRWAMVLLRPGETAANADARLYLESAADFERHAAPLESRAAFDAAAKRWPAEPVALIGRGNAQYRLGNLQEAARDYAAAVTLDATQTGARNNLAQTLLDLQCPRGARRQLAQIDVATLKSPLREAVLDTLAKTAAVAEHTADAGHCPAMP